MSKLKGRPLQSQAEMQQVRQEAMEGLGGLVVNLGVVKNGDVAMFDIKNNSPWAFNFWQRSCTCLADGEITKGGFMFKGRAKLESETFDLPVMTDGNNYYLKSAKLNAKGTGALTVYTNLKTNNIVDLSEEELSKLHEVAVGQYNHQLYFYFHEWTPMYFIRKNGFLEKNDLKPLVAIAVNGYVLKD